MNNIILMSLNNDMTRVIEQTGNGYEAYTVIGTMENNNINFKDIIDKKTKISAQELFNFSFTPTQEALYRKQELYYATQDIKNHAEELCVFLDDSECELLAERYLLKMDCNLSPNSQMDGIIEDYIISKNSFEINR